MNMYMSSLSSVTFVDFGMAEVKCDFKDML